MKKINVITLGCSKNVVDSEHLMAQLEAAGIHVNQWLASQIDRIVEALNTNGAWLAGQVKQNTSETLNPVTGSVTF